MIKDKGSPVKKIDNIRVLAFLHDENLVYDEFFPRLMRQIHFFDRDFPAGGECFGDVDVSGGARNKNSVTGC